MFVFSIGCSSVVEGVCGMEYKSMGQDMSEVWYIYLWHGLSVVYDVCL